ncbi:ADP-ribosylation factor-binding protein GGA3-like [Gigantopelta aegis]|uniref:ADP-ribosylation factor-binding protein GGA3-like n=1 Tax=Gigantopelta aegis TaxID=1735272 RepID=UPI001B888A93|nr:ADP-ribosylation factor-binding protein GGA3-like [Gigantopelta aegis]
MAGKDETLETLLNRATNPAMRDEDWDHIMAFCDQVNRELEGPQTAVRLLAHKIQSPQEREALFALSTLEASVKNCGKRFHQEIGKFRFLNEMIKVVSPKYLGNRTTATVKKRCIEIMYSWYMGLKHETKIVDAYMMLKAQGIVKEDPTYIEKTFEPFASEKPRLASFEDEEKSKILAKLLKSRNPEDLQAANRMIKNLVKQDIERSERVSKRINELETIGNNVKLLNEMVLIYDPNTTSTSEKEMMKELCESLEKLRPNLFRLASDTDDKDSDGINDILKANDAVMKCMAEYKRKVEGVVSQNGDWSSSKDVSSLLDLNFDHSQAKSSPAHAPTAKPTSTSAAILEDELQTLGLDDKMIGGGMSDMTAVGGSGNVLDELGDLFSQQPPNPGIQLAAQSSVFSPAPRFTMASSQPTIPVIPPHFNQSPVHRLQHPAQQPMPLVMATGLSASSTISGLPEPIQAVPMATTNSMPVAAKDSTEKPVTMTDLDLLGQNLVQENLAKDPHRHIHAPIPVSKVPMNQMNQSAPVTQSSQSPQTLLDSEISTQPVSMASFVAPSSPQAGLLSLTDVFVPLESVQPATDLEPITVYDKNSLKTVMHCGKGKPRPDVAVFVISTLSTNTHPVKHFVFQAAVPKIMKVKLQPPSSSDLPAFNPILPPSAITQVMLVANPKKEKIRLKFKVSYELNNQTVTDLGETDKIPIQ